MPHIHYVDDYRAGSEIRKNVPDISKGWECHVPTQDLYKILQLNWEANPQKTLDAVFYMRNCRGKGRGQNQEFYAAVEWFMNNHPDDFLPRFQDIIEHGCWKDLWVLWDRCDELFRAYVIYIVSKQLKTDIENLMNGNGHLVTLAGKWAPGERSSFNKEYGAVKLLCEQLGWSLRTYRINLSKLRNHLEVPERMICDKRWAEIDFDTFPARARQKYHYQLKKNCGARYRRYCEKWGLKK